MGKQCALIKKRCDLLLHRRIRFCFECNEFPCTRLVHLDERYRTNFRMCMIENLELISREGISKLLEREEQKWKCTKCGGIICCHNGVCFNCRLDELSKRANPYRGQD